MRSGEIGFGPNMDELKDLLKEYLKKGQVEREGDHELLIRLDTKIDVVLSQMLKMLEDHELRLRTIDKRLSAAEAKGEKSEGKVTGWLAGAAFVLALVGDAIHFLFGK